MGPIIFDLIFGSSMALVSAVSFFQKKGEKHVAAVSPSATNQVSVAAPVVCDVAPIPMKVTDFDVIAGKVSGRLVLHQSIVTGEVNRLLILQPSQGNSKTIKLEPIGGDFYEILESSISEAKSLGNAIFGKKNKASKTKKSPGNATAKPGEMKPVAMGEEIPSQTATEPSSQPGEVPALHKGFKSVYEGVFVSGKIEKHLKSKADGTPEEYSAFTVTLNTARGLEQVQGNDLKRVCEVEGVKPGDPIRIIHLRDAPIANGRYKKYFAIIKLNKENQHERQ